MAQLPCIGLPCPLTKPPFGSCAIYFHYGVPIISYGDFVGAFFFLVVFSDMFPFRRPGPESSTLARACNRGVWFSCWVSRWYCWWTKSCTTNHDDYPIIYKVLTIPGGAGFCPSTVTRCLGKKGWINLNLPWKKTACTWKDAIPKGKGSSFKNAFSVCFWLCHVTCGLCRYVTWMLPRGK